MLVETAETAPLEWYALMRENSYARRKLASVVEGSASLTFVFLSPNLTFSLSLKENHGFGEGVLAVAHQGAKAA